MSIRFGSRNFALVVGLLAPVSCTFQDAETRGSENAIAQATSASLAPVDISFMLPLASARFSFPISTASQELGGALITEEQYDALGTFVAKKDSGETEGAFGSPPIFVRYQYPDFDVVGFRFDICGGEKVPDDLDPAKCGLPVIRLVAQPTTNKNVSADDKALHLIYRFERNMAVEILSDLKALKVQGETLTGRVTADSPLGIHPGLEAMDSRVGTAEKPAQDVKKSQQFGEVVKKFVLKYCGTSRLFAVASMRGGFVGGAQLNQWDFRTSLVDKGTIRNIPITGVDQSSAVDGASAPFTRQLFSSPLEGNFPDSFSLDPAFAKKIRAYIGQHSRHVELPTISTSEFLTLKAGALAEAATIENPKSLKVTQGDCVSCHVTTRLLQSATKNTKFPLGSTAINSIATASYTPPKGVSNKLADFDLENKTSGNLFLNFGYRNTMISISQRTANETAELIPLVNAWSVRPVSTEKAREARAGDTKNGASLSPRHEGL
jgi:hypothetical protein